MTVVATGQCACGEVAFALTKRPLFVHCCHCTWCQRESGTGFALNGIIEASAVDLTRGAPVEVPVPSESGAGQVFSRCPTCQIAVWSVYSSPKLRFIRMGTLNERDQFPPDIHIYTSTKLPWVTLPPDVPSFPEFYRRSEQWPADSLARRAAVMAE